jgi:DNA replication and repair protein RecF
MHIEHLTLTNFRNYSRLAVDFPPGIVLLHGANAQGKTNLLEAIHLLSRIRSPRTGNERELVNWLTLQDNLPFTRLVARVRREEESFQIELALLQSKPESAPPDSVSWRKSIRIDGVGTRSTDAVGILPVVLFLPQDVDIVAASPSLRRNYLDDTISQADREYRRELRRYGQVLSQRNHLLRSLRERSHHQGELRFWDERLIQHGSYVTAHREQAVQQLGEAAERIHERLTGQGEHLRLEYRSSILSSGPAKAPDELALLPENTAQGTTVTERAPQIAEAYAEQLAAARKKELERGVTIVGPHRDDLGFLANEVDLNIYGSRGQQRTSALSLKLAEVEWLTQKKGDSPILLLDDMVSELDPLRRNLLLAAMDDVQQVVITANSLDPYHPDFLARCALWHVRAGRMETVTPD